MPNLRSWTMPVTTPDSEVAQEEPAPGRSSCAPTGELGRIVPASVGRRLHDCQYEGVPDSQRNEDEMEHRGDPNLPARDYHYSRPSDWPTGSARPKVPLSETAVPAGPAVRPDSTERPRPDSERASSTAGSPNRAAGRGTHPDLENPPPGGRRHRSPRSALVPVGPCR